LDVEAQTPGGRSARRPEHKKERNGAPTIGRYGFMTSAINEPRAGTSAVEAMTAAEILDGTPDRIHVVYERFARETPDHPAFVEGDRVWTYRQFSDAVDSVAADLTRFGIRPGDRVMMASENCVAVSAFVLAASRLDAWAIVGNPRLSARELDQIAEHSGARRQFFAVSVSKEAAQHAARLGASIGALGPFADVGVASLNENTMPEPVHADGARQVAVLIYTSGTTGVPKGVMLSHRNLLFSAKVQGLMIGTQAQDRIYGVLPMSHIVGLTIILVSTLMFGATIVIVSHYDPAHLAGSIASGATSIVYGVPATYQRLLALVSPDGKGTLARGNLRCVFVAGAPLDLTLKQRTEGLLGVALQNGYGITECSPGISGVRKYAPRDDESVGSIVPGVDIRVMALDGATVPDGEVGELHVRGPNVMLGYYRAPDLTAKAVVDGWFATGDLVRYDGGALFVVGRTKEMIIRSGFNVYPAEIEAVINAHPAVLQSAVVGRAVEGNEEVVAFVQLVPGVPATVDTLHAFIRPQLTAYKRPSEIIILDSFPAGSTGKILKHRLKEQAQRA
jgi:long-chain acyl-CoA synthetase